MNVISCYTFETVYNPTENSAGGKGTQESSFLEEFKKKVRQAFSRSN